MPYSNSRSTFFCPSGTKWYWEFVPTTGYNYAACGITTNSHQHNINPGGGNSTPNGHGVGYYNNEVDVDGSRLTASGASAWASGDIIGFAYDVDARSLRWYTNNTLNYTYTTVPVSTDGDYSPSFGDFGGSVAATINVNFGQDSSFAGLKTAQGNSDINGYGDFYYTPPTDYLALCSKNLSDPSIPIPTEHFDTIIWTGAAETPGAARTVTGLSFQPDFFFQGAGAGGGGGAHLTYDVLRGFGNDKEITTDSSKVEGGENADGYGYVSAVTSNGVTYSPGTQGYGNNVIYYDTNGAKYIRWNWKAGGTGVANTTGSIDSTVSANTTAGFSIVTYTGEDNAGDTVGHGLTQAPEMIIVKDLTTAEDWQGYDVTGGPTKYIQLNDTGGYATDTTRWNDTAPTATVFSLGTSDKVNDAGDDYVAYCFHSIEGYSKVGTYKGNGNTSGFGPFIFTDFSPAYVLIKRTDGGGSWAILNNKSPGYNVINNSLYASDANAETTGAGVTSSIVDFVSNGIKVRGYSSNVNNSSGTYIYMAFAENPFKTSNAR